MPPSDKTAPPRGALPGLTAALLLPAAQAMAEPVADAADPVLRNLNQALFLVVGILVLLALVPLVLFLYRRLFWGALGSPGNRTDKDPEARGEALARKGDFLGAAEALEEAGQTARAAALYEKGKDFTKAAELYEAAGEPDRAVELHLRGGGALRAAAIHIRHGRYTAAAKIFKNKGDHLRAAQALEKGGSKAAAAREYVEARNCARAARLFRESEFFPEAAEAYRQSLGAKELSPTTLEAYYTYAAYLLLAGEREKAVGIYGRILEINPDHERTREKLGELAGGKAGGAAEPGEPAGGEQPAAPAREQVPGTGAPAAGDMASSLSAELGRGEASHGDAGDPFERVATLRNMITHTRLDVRYAMRLWIQMMRALGERHRKEKVYYGCLAPEQVLIDMQNNIRFEIAWVRDPVYTAPEVRGGAVPDEQSDLWAMGVMLYEMLTGSTEGLGEKHPRELREDVPEWLDELVMRCVNPDRGGRFTGLDDVSAELVRLKSRMQ